MYKIPVSETITHAYGFLVRRPLTILGMSWLPAIVYAAGAGFWLQKLSADMLAAPHGGLIDNNQIFDLFGFGVVTALTSAILGVILTHDAAERSNRGVAAYFVISGKEWRLFAARLEVYLLSGIVALAAAITVRAGIPLLMAVIAKRVWLGIPAQTYALDGMLFIAVIALATILVRFNFFSGAQVVAEEHAKLSRNWTLSHGNFWRLLIVEFFLLAPLTITLVAAAWISSRPEFGNAVTALFSSAHDPSRLYQWMSNNAAAIAAAFSIGIVVLNALFAGASASAYSATQSVAQRTPEESAPYFSETERAFADYRPRADTVGVPSPRHELEVIAAEARGVERPLPVSQFPLPAAGPAYEEHLPEEMPVVHTAFERSVAEEQIAGVHQEDRPGMDQAVPVEAPAAIDTPVSLVRELSPEPEATETEAMLAEADVVEAHAKYARKDETEVPAGDVTGAETHEAIASAESTSVEPIKLTEEEAMVTPPLSAGDATESSPQSAPLEAV